MDSGAKSISSWQAVILALHIFALCVTLLRVIDRLSMKRLWWDDYLVIIPLVLDPILVFIFIKVDLSASPTTNNVFYSYIFVSFIFETILWTSRVILVLGLARIFPTWSRTHRIAISLAAFFVFLYIGSIVITGVACKLPGQPLYRATIDDCKQGVNNVDIKGVFLISGDIAADTMLAALPTIILWHIKFPPHQRRLIITTASASVLTLIATASLSTLWYGNFYTGPRIRRLNETAAYHVELIMAIIVSNLLVVVTWAYRMIHRRRGKPQPARTEQPQPDSSSSSSEETKSRTRSSTRSTRVTEMTTVITFTDVETDPELHADSRSEYLEVDSLWAGTRGRSFRSQEHM